MHAHPANLASGSSYDGRVSDTYTVQRSAVSTADRATLHALVNDFHRWQEWSPWEGLDPAMERTYDGPPSGTGAIYEWSGNRKAGAGRMEIVSDTPDRTEIALDFLKPFKSSSTTIFTFDPEGQHTRVTWTMTGKKTLATKVFTLVKSMDSLVGPDFERGLARLTDVAEGIRDQ